MGAGILGTQRPDAGYPLHLHRRALRYSALCGSRAYPHRSPFQRAGYVLLSPVVPDCAGRLYFTGGPLRSRPLHISQSDFSILKGIRERILNKLPRLPLGTVLDISSGQMKQIIVDQVKSMERPLAHLLPEMTANLLAPACILVYLFILNWRIALLSLVSIPVGLAFTMAVMKNYGKQYEGSVKVNQAMNATIVEYIGGTGCHQLFYPASADPCRLLYGGRPPYCHWRQIKTDSHGIF